MLLIFVYGIAGMYLFGSLDLTVTQAMDPQSNFNTFYNSVSILFTSITGEQWDVIMTDCMGNPGCSGGLDKCGNPFIAVAFWVTFTILGQYFFLNMFIAVLLDNFNEDVPKLENSGICDRDLKKYQKTWSKFAPLGDYNISYKHLSDFLNHLEAPLGFKGQNLSRAQRLGLIHALGFKENNGLVNFAEVLWILAGAIAGCDLSTAPKCEAVNNILKALPMDSKLTIDKNIKNSSVFDDLASRKVAAFAIYNRWKIVKDNIISKNLRRFSSTIWLALSFNENNRLRL